MPTYSYHCANCEHEFDTIQGFNEADLTTCPVCGKVALRRVYKPVGVVFKGSGFYATDNKSPSGIQHSKNGNTEKTETSPATDSKSESSKTESSPTVAEKS